MAKYLVDISFRKKLINHWEQERLKTNDPRKIISILKNVLGQTEYEKALKESLQAKPELIEEFPIYKHLIKLRSIYVTTNIEFGRRRPCKKAKGVQVGKEVGRTNRGRIF